jgi:hypothetical protein
MVERGRQAFAPEASVITAASKQEGETGALLAKDNSVTVLPQVPAAEECESRRRFPGHRRDGGIGVELPDAGVGGEKSPNTRPEQLSKAALEHDVVRGLARATADGADVLRRRNYFPPCKEASALDPVPRKKLKGSVRATRGGGD